jgi:hypothetical protein
VTKSLKLVVKIVCVCIHRKRGEFAESLKLVVNIVCVCVYIERKGKLRSRSSW